MFGSHIPVKGTVHRGSHSWFRFFLFAEDAQETFALGLLGLTDREVAELLRVSRRTLQEYRNNRVLPFILLGGKVLYPESGLRELLEANYRKPME